MDKTQNLYKKARIYLNLTLRKSAELAGVSHGAVQYAESGKGDNINHRYTIFLVEQGINYFYLIGQSDQIEGQRLVDVVSVSDYEKLQSDYELLYHKVKEYESVFKMLKIELPEGSDVRKKGKCVKKQPSRKSQKTGVLHADNPLFAERAVY